MVAAYPSIGREADVIARVAEPGPGLAVAEIDRTLQHELRGRFPALAHRKFKVAEVTE